MTNPCLRFVCILVLSSSAAAARAALARIPEGPVAATALAASPLGGALVALPESIGAEADKKLVLDFFRVVFEAQNAEAAKHFLKDDYIQHNPLVATGRDAFIAYFKDLFKKRGGPKPVEPTLRNPPALVAVHDGLVWTMWKVDRQDPADRTKTYESFWFDVFRVENGLIVEHWDNALKN